MRHSIPINEVGPLAQEMALAVTKCVHCGFCLPACPTYNLLGEEMDSPRGRIILMKSVLEGEIELDEAMPYIERCLGCLGCVSACPSGVPYGELINPFRAYSFEKRSLPPGKRFSRLIEKETIPYPHRFKKIARAGRFVKPISNLLPTQFRVMIDLLPDAIPPEEKLPSFYPALGKRRARVALLTGCVQQVLAPNINWASLRVLSANGVEVVIPENQTCCGGLAFHSGDKLTASHFAQNNMQVFPEDVDAIITNAAGCGSTMREYSLLFKGSEYYQLAEQFLQRVFDISVFLHELGISPPPELNTPLTVVYQDACHLAHAQGIIKEPRELLSQIPNLTIIPLPEADMCCGSAGSYNIEQPAIAQELGKRKVRNILETNAEGVVTGNIGCLIQIRNHLTKLTENDKRVLPVWHIVEVLDMAYRGVKGVSG